MKNNKKSQQIIAAAVMGMNLVNTLSPVAALAANPVKAVPQQPEQPKQEAKPLEYMSLPQVLQAVDDAVFAKAEGANYTVTDGQNSTVPELNKNDSMTISSGGIGSVGKINSSAAQSISSVGQGFADTVIGGSQVVSSGGYGSVNTVRDFGAQEIWNGANGTATIVTDNGTQMIAFEGYGYADTVTKNGEQHIARTGKGSANIISDGGSQTITFGGTGYVTDLNSGGTQYISKAAGTAAYGTATNINDGGVQIVYGSGSAINVNNGGTQLINSGARGTAGNLFGSQVILSDGSGSAQTAANGGIQYVSSGAYGEVNVGRDNGTQIVYEGARGSASALNNGGTQIISGGSADVWHINNGGEQIISAGNGYAEVINGNTGVGGLQQIDGGSGKADSVYGTQVVNDGAYGSAMYLNNQGSQIVNDGGTGEVRYINSNGTQIVNGGSASAYTVASGGVQLINSNAVASAYYIDRGGHQQIDGGSGIADSIYGTQTVNNGVGSVYEIENSGIQVVNGGTGSAQFNREGTQVINGGTGMLWLLVGDGSQIINDGEGIVTSLEADAVQIVSGGKGKADWISYDGTQIIKDGAGEVGTVHGGTQIVSGGSGAIDRLTGSLTTGVQIIENGGKGTVKDLIVSSTQIINNGGKSDETVVNGGTQIINDGAAAEKTTVKDGIQIIYGGDVTNTTVSGGTVHYENANANVSNVTMTGGTYMLNADSGSYNIKGKFDFTGGVVDMTQVPGDAAVKHSYETLNIENLSGSGGAFKLNTDLASETNGDKVNITNAAAGTTAYVQVSDESLFNNTTVTGEKKLLIVTDNSNNASFNVVGKELNNGGLWEVTPVIKNGALLGEDSKNWYLTTIFKEINNDTQVIIESMDNAYALWCNTKDSLRKRMGELHMLPVKPDSDGVWARYTGGEYEGEGYNGNYNFYQLGWDKNYDGKSIYGFALEKGGGNASYEFGSGENDLFAGSLYATWLGDDGSYTDVVAKVGRYDSEVNSYGDYPDHADYENNAYSLSVEYGKNIKLNEHGTYIEPQAQVIAGRLEGVDYITDRGQKIHGSSINSFIGRVGFLIGERTPDGNNVYFKASALHEFGGAGSLSMLAANGETLSMDKDYSDTWFELGIGGNFKIGHNSYLYGDIERSFGGDMNKLWQVVAGLRFEF